MTRICASALVAIAALVGCDSAAPLPQTGVTLEVGTADERGDYLAVDQGDALVLATGGQAGFHVWSKIRIQGVEGTVYVERSMRRVEDDALVLRANTYVIDLPKSAKGSMFEPVSPLANFMCPLPVGITVLGEALYLTTTLTDEDRNPLAESIIEFVPLCPEGDLRQICEQICSGE